VGLLSSHLLGSQMMGSRILASSVLGSRVLASGVMGSGSCDRWWCSSASFSRDGRIRSLLGVVVMSGLVDGISSVSSYEEEFNDQVAQNEEARGRYR
jgi:hypothetical protein